MHTYLLGDDDMRRYGRDIIARLELLQHRIPRVWCTLGISGDKLAEFLLQEFESSAAIPDHLVRISADRVGGTVAFRGGSEVPSFGDRPVLLLDSAIHSGASMRMSADFLHAAGARDLLTYSLVIKRTTEFAPTFFGLVLDEHDRAFFQLDRYPNSKLLPRTGFGNVRALRWEDIERTPDHVDTDVPSIAKISFADLWYSCRAHGERVFVYETAGVIRAFIHFKTKGDIVVVDAVVSDRSMNGQGIGALLMRWVETLARSSHCRAIELWSIAARVGWYRGLGYETVADEALLDLGGGESYTRMRRRILYNVKPSELSA